MLLPSFTTLYCLSTAFGIIIIRKYGIETIGLAAPPRLLNRVFSAKIFLHPKLLIMIRALWRRWAKRVACCGRDGGMGIEHCIVSLVIRVVDTLFHISIVYLRTYQ